MDRRSHLADSGSVTPQDAYWILSRSQCTRRQAMPSTDNSGRHRRFPTQRAGKVTSTGFGVP